MNISASGATQYHFKLRAQPTAVAEEGSSAPEDFQLLPSYPNPFSLRAHAASLSITYELSRAAQVEVMITNTLGQIVQRLVARNQNAGRHVVSWNGEAERGQSVSAGVYFVQLRAGGSVMRQKVTVVR